LTKPLEPPINKTNSSASVVSELRDKVMLSCRMIGARGVSRGSFGHVSARVPGEERILIKAKGPDEEALEFATAAAALSVTRIGAQSSLPDRTEVEAFLG